MLGRMWRSMAPWLLLLCACDGATAPADAGPDPSDAAGSAANAADRALWDTAGGP